MRPVIIVGGGWAGLAAAVELSRRRVPVALMEAGNRAGGRARRIADGDRPLDNGQHLFLGAFRETLSLLDKIGVREADVFERVPLQMRIRSAQRDIRLSLPGMPAPFHLIGGLQRITGLSLREQLRAVRLGLGLVKHSFTVRRDTPVDAWLERHHQSQSLIHNIWNPLCLATLNTPAHEASAEVFMHVLHDAFLRRREDSDLLIPRTDLSTILPDPAVAYLAGRGGSLKLDTPVTDLLVEAQRITGVRTAQGVEPAERVILAVPYYEALRLLQPHAPFADIAGKLSSFTATPITTVFLEYPRPVALDVPFTGIVDGNPLWVFDGTRRGQAQLVSVVISGDGPHGQMDDAALARRIGAALARYYPHWPSHTGGRVIREPRATFACRTGINALRPANATPVEGCWLAGDYTATGYPATLEGAVLSGGEAARQLSQARR